MERRRVVAIAWGVAVALGLMSWLVGQLLGLTVLCFASLVPLALGAPLVPSYADERLELPVAYRAVAFVAFVVPLAGALLAALPHSASDMHVCAAFFVLQVWLGYRSLVARNAQQALLMTFCGLLVWVPFYILFGIDWDHGSGPSPDMTELTSFRILFAAQFVNALASGTALLAFQPRTEGLPEARLLRELHDDN